MTNSKELRSAVARQGKKYRALAAVLGITPYGLQKKIDNLSEFKASEILKLSDALLLSEEERDHIFLCKDA